MPSALVGCNASFLIDKMIPKAEDAIARDYISLIQQHKIDEIEKHLDPKIVTPSTRESLEQMASLFPDGDPLSVKVVGVFFFYGPDAATTSLSYEYEFPDKWITANVVLRKVGEDSMIYGIHVTPLADSLEHTNRFTLTGKNPIQYFVLATAIFAPVITLVALIVCIRTKLKRRKWLWLLAIIIGFGKLSVDWTTGQWYISCLSFQLFSASFFGTPYSPWIVSVSIPLGAIVFLWNRNKLLQEQIDTDCAEMPLNPENGPALSSTPQV
jgi:hypothetical protein